MTSLGQFEQLLLTAILKLGNDAYGVSIQAKAAELAHPKEVSLGAIYVTLDRLEDKGLVSSSRLSDADSRARWTREARVIGNSKPWGTRAGGISDHCQAHLGRDDGSLGQAGKERLGQGVRLSYAAPSA